MNTPFEERVGRAVEQSLGEATDFLRQVLAIPTPRMEEQACVRFFANAMTEAGWEAEVFAGKGLGEPTPAGPPLNVVARRRGTGGGRTLLLGAHLDTVPPGDTRCWRHGPWSAAQENGRIYARGAHDDRTGAALIAIAARLMNRLDFSTRGDIYALVTTEEEYSGGGMKAYLQRADRVRPDAYLMLDGNQRDQAITGHPGALNFRIRIPGCFGSAQDPSIVHDANAIELAAVVVQALREFEREVRKQRADDPRWPQATVAVTGIDSTGWISNVPEECVVHGFCNVIPPAGLDDYKSRFEAFVARASGASAWSRDHPPCVEWGPLEVPAMITAETSEFVQLLRDTHLGDFGRPLTTRYIGGWGDPRLLGCPQTVFWGPGGGGGDHAYDEFYDLADLAPSLKTVLKVAQRWCDSV